MLHEIREQILYLKELGVDSLDVHLPCGDQVENVEAASDARAAFVKELPPEGLISSAKGEQPSTTRPIAQDRSKLIVQMPKIGKREAPLVGETIQSSSADTELKMIAAEGAEPGGQREETFPATVDTIESIRVEIGADCSRCTLHGERKQVVQSTGNLNARLMFVGEAPGADEDEQGLPFVGRAGQLLTKIIESIGFTRDEVFIGNINRCRPPGNRPPTPAETAACRPFLLREIAVLRPQVIVVLGTTAAHNLLQIKTPISKIRGHFHEYFGVKVMPTFHPAYLLRDPHKKREVWEDMKKVRDHLAENSSR